MNDIITWYDSMPLLLQVFWGCAIISSAVFAVQMVLTLMGIDSSDMDVDFDGGDTLDLGGGLNLFTIKNLIGFLVGFGWAGVSFYGYIESPVLLTLLAFVVGCLFVAMFVLIYRQTRRLEHNGAFNVNDVVGKTVSVYLRIPSHGQGKGKIQVSLNGSVQEFDAETDGDEIPSGTKVTVLELIDKETVRV